MRRRHASSSGKPRWHPSGTVRATLAVIRFSRSINPICTASLTKPPSELKKIGRSRFAKPAKNSRNRWAAPSSNLPSPAIHSVQPRPQAFSSPVATTKIIGLLRTFASRRSSSLGSSLAAIETTGRQQSATAIHRINLQIIVPFLAEHRREIVLCSINRSAANDGADVGRRKLRRFSAAAATSREAHRSPRSSPAVLHPRWIRGPQSVRLGPHHRANCWSHKGTDCCGPS